MLGLLDVIYGVGQHMAHMVVGQSIFRLAPPTGGGDESDLAQMPQMLGNKRLTCSRGIGKLMHASGTGDQRAQDSQTHWIGEGLEEIRRGFQLLIRSHINILAERYE